MLKVNEYGERQAKENGKNLCFKGWETLVIKEKPLVLMIFKPQTSPQIIEDTLSLQQAT